MRTGFLILLVVVLATACVTITPRVSSGTTPPDVSTPPATPKPATSPTAGDEPPAPTAQPTETATAVSTDKPTSTPRPPKSPKPTSAPTVAATTDPNDPACSDDAYTLEGFHWNTSYHWHFNADSTPADYDSDVVLADIKTGVQNIVDEHNDCGRADTVHAFAEYQGETKVDACTASPDGQNTIAWGEIPSDVSEDVIAYTCPYYSTDTDLAYEADIVINDQIPWALTKDDCLFEELLVPTITHEVGHVFGLGHVSERDHPDLTMSTRSNGPCDDIESTLGLGDMLGLESLYPGS